MLRSLTTLTCALLAAGPLAAQTVSGTLVDEASGAPVRGALVTLSDAAGNALRSALTDASGAFALRAPGPGQFRVQAERVGMRTASAGPIALAAEEARTLRLSTRATALALEGLQVRARDRGCVVDPRSGPRTAALWDEARKALRSAVWTRTQQGTEYTLRTFRRTLDVPSLAPRSEEADTATIRALRPFTALPAAELSRGGYVRRDGQDMVYYPPDEDVLLSETFLDEHCFRLRPGRDGQVGLEFEPARGRRLPDVRGVLWLDASTAELRALDYAFTGVDVPAARGVDWGGRVEFARMAEGGWMIRHWVLRMPVMGLPRFAHSSLRPRGLEPYVHSVVEVGGEVVAVRPPGGERTAPAGDAPGGPTPPPAARDTAPAGAP